MPYLWFLYLAAAWPLSSPGFLPRGACYGLSEKEKLRFPGTSDCRLRWARPEKTRGGLGTAMRSMAIIRILNVYWCMNEAVPRYPRECHNPKPRALHFSLQANLSACYILLWKPDHTPAILPHSLLCNRPSWEKQIGTIEVRARKYLQPTYSHPRTAAVQGPAMLHHPLRYNLTLVAAPSTLVADQPTFHNQLPDGA
ncbi:hypothetical protein B0T10DRAFT_456214 [Thelonectria olida]|uniref:Uncharacterized protein n=1 Tax=Thelonectria olida TaxID=1576542 RepID=A0A9P8WDL4_9HYPO|nr:hypothetical protein B0T10DRAFT_456214 [Thelonectria olida]